MAYSYVKYTGTGAQSVWTIPFSYLDVGHVFVYVDGTPAPFSFNGPSSVSIAPAPALGASIQISRNTLTSAPPVDFTDGSILLEADLDRLSKFALYTAQESFDRAHDPDGAYSTVIIGGGGGGSGAPLTPEEVLGLLYQRLTISEFGLDLAGRIDKIDNPVSGLQKQIADLEADIAAGLIGAQAAEDAAASAVAAAASALAAAQAEVAAEIAAGNAVVARQASETAATNASGSATAANTSATLATTKADAAGVSALSAQTHALSAAASAATATNISNAAAVLPSNFFAGMGNWTNALVGDPAVVATANGTVIANDADFGTCGEITDLDLVGEAFMTKGVVPATPGRAYRITARFKSTASDGSATMSVVTQSMGSDYVGVGVALTNVVTFGTGEIVNITALVSDVAPVGGHAWHPSADVLRFGIRLDTAETGLTLRIRHIIVEDITVQLAAAASATAANNSAGLASASADSAGASSIAANTAKLAAEASQGLAAGSATAANSSASVATAQATAAGNSATSANTAKLAAEASQSAAAGSATAANTSEGVATTQATAADNSATAANTAKLAAESAQGAAAGHASAANTSASTASTAATAASTSATAANTAKLAAESAQAAAAGHATAANSSASLATTKADEAGVSATAANTAQLAAEASQGLALGHANSANSSASLATASAGEAATSATSSAANLSTLQAMVGRGAVGIPLSMWNLNGQTIQTITDGKVGFKTLRLTGTHGAHPNQGVYVPLDPTKKYRVRFWARPSADNTAGLLYFTLRQFTDDLGTPGPVNLGRSPYKPADRTPTAHNLEFGADQWGEYSAIWGPPDWQAGAKFVLPEFLDNNPGAAGHWDIQDFTFEEATATETLAASIDTVAIASADAMGVSNAKHAIKVQARADGKFALAGIGINATATTDVAQSELILFADKLQFVASASDLNAVPQVLLQQGLVDGANTLIIPATRVGDKVLDARMFVEGLFQASNVLTRGLTVRDDLGNVVLSSGVPLDWARVGGAAKAADNAGKVVDGFRDTSPTPIDYKAGETFFFKNSNIFTLPGGGAGTYGTLRTLRPYGVGTDLSGGAVIQWFESDGLVWSRKSSGSFSWGLWEAVPNGKITPANASTFISNLAITNAFIGNSISSNDFNGTITEAGAITNNGTAGWAIGKAGKAVFQDVYVRGNIQATSLNGTGIVETVHVGQNQITNSGGASLLTDVQAGGVGQYLQDDEVTILTFTYTGTGNPMGLWVHVRGSNYFSVYDTFFYITTYLNNVRVARSTFDPVQDTRWEHSHSQFFASPAPGVNTVKVVVGKIPGTEGTGRWVRALAAEGCSAFMTEFKR